MNLRVPHWLILTLLLVTPETLHAQEPVLPTNPTFPEYLYPQNPVFPAVPALEKPPISTQRATSSWAVWSQNPGTGHKYWKNGGEFPFEGRNPSWGSHELLTASPSGLKIRFTQGSKADWDLSLDPDTQVWWRGAAAGTEALSLTVPGGNFYLKARGTSQYRGTVKVPDLTLNFISASFTVLQSPSGDFLLVCTSGYLDVVSEKYRFRMHPQRGYERIAGEPRYFEVPFDAMGKVIQDWRTAAAARAFTEKGVSDRITQEKLNLDQQFRVFQGWGGELQYWQNRLLSSTALTQAEKANALGRLASPVKEWEALVADQEILAAKLDRLLINPSKNDLEALNKWSAERIQWHNRLSQLRFALEIYNKIQGPVKSPPSAVPKSSTNPTNLNQLIDPASLLKSLF